MSQDFLPGLARLKDASPDEVIRQLHEMFRTIVRMDLDDAIAAYQTIQAVTKDNGMQFSPGVESLLSSLEAQMVNKASDFPLSSDRNRISTVTGKRFGLDGLGKSSWRL